jgi:cobalt-zinc-cadmium efflux system membrane fusion protein
MRKDEKIIQKRAISWMWVIMIGLFAVVAMFAACGKKESEKEEKKSATAEKTEKKEAHDKNEEHGVVVLSEEKQKASGIEVQKVSLDSVSIPLSTTAVIELNADRVSKVSPRVTGRVVRVLASQGDRVKAGQPLAYLDSVELDQAWAEYVKAKGRLELAQKNLKREETLFEKKVSPEKDVLKARQEVTETEADLNLLRERFRLFGIDISQVEQQKNGGGNERHPLIPITSTITGAVLEKALSQGEVVGPEKTLFTVADLSTLWVILDIYEKDIPRLHVGTPAKISVTAFPDKEFRGRISLISDILDEKTRTVKARVTVDNSSELLKPGMFATASIDSGKDYSTRKVIAVPEEAIFLDGSERYVFLREAEGRFVVRRISVGPASGQKIEIKEGLKAGDTVVTKGVFELKSELKKETLHDDGHGH